MHRVPNRLSRGAAPLLAAGALVATLWGGTATAAAAPVAAAAPTSASVVTGLQHWDDDDWDDDDWDGGRYHHRHWDDDDLEDYPYCDRRGNGYGCPEYGYPPEW